MSILIKGLDMTKHGIVINIYADGRVTDHFDEFQETIGTVVPVPTPHGRLIDADAYEALLRCLGNREYRREKGTIRDAIKFLHPHYAPTIIEAEGEDDG